VIFEALALLLAEPVHKEPVVYVHGSDRDQHVDDNTKGRNATEQSNDQAQAAEEFGADGEKRQRRGNAQPLGKETHGAVETVTSEPAQHLLCAMREKHDTQNQANQSECEVVCGRKQFTQRSPPGRTGPGAAVQPR
jgi:hypothetical protein